MLEGNIVQSSEASQEAMGAVPEEFFQSLDGDFATPNGTGDSVPQPEIDEELQSANGDPDKIGRIWQSRHDKLMAEYNKTKTSYTDYEKKAQILEQIATDSNMLRAFVSKVAPDLLPSVDPAEMIKSALDKKFGEDFVPDEREAKMPWTKSGQYYKMANELYEQYENQNKNVGNFDELLQERARREQNQQKEMEAIRTDLKTRFNADDTQINQFVEFSKKLTHVDLYRLFKATSKFKTPNIASQQSNANLGMSQSRADFLKEL